MSSRTFFQYKFYYTDERGQTSIKSHRSYLNADGVTEDTPTTDLFRDRIVDTPEKVTGTSQGLRNVLCSWMMPQRKVFLVLFFTLVRISLPASTINLSLGMFCSPMWLN